MFNKNESSKLIVSFFGVLKMVRIFRIRGLITAATIDAGLKAVLNFIFLTVMLMYYCHLTGCYWYYIIYKDYCNINTQID